LAGKRTARNRTPVRKQENTETGLPGNQLVGNQDSQERGLPGKRTARENYSQEAKQPGKQIKNKLITLTL